MKKKSTPAQDELLARIRASRPKPREFATAHLGTIFLRAPTGADQYEMSELRKRLGNAVPHSVFAASVAATLLVSADNERVFEDVKAGFEELNAMGAGALNELGEILVKLLDEEKAVAKAQTAEELS
jgi:hypothetical protein